MRVDMTNQIRFEGCFGEACVVHRQSVGPRPYNTIVEIPEGASVVRYANGHYQELRDGCLNPPEKKPEAKPRCLFSRKKAGCDTDGVDWKIYFVSKSKFSAGCGGHVIFEDPDYGNVKETVYIRCPFNLCIDNPELFLGGKIHEKLNKRSAAGAGSYGEEAVAREARELVAEVVVDKLSEALKQWKRVAGIERNRTAFREDLLKSVERVLRPLGLCPSDLQIELEEDALHHEERETAKRELQHAKNGADINQIQRY